MSSITPTFKTKQDRDEFFIALAVITLLGLFLWWNMRGEVPLPQGENAIVAVVDTDNDGVSDDDDLCPEVAGSIYNDGCPDAPLDTDGDGIADADDACPDHIGSVELNGCPADTDGDGIHDGIDKCPNVIGLKGSNGCPPDADGDGIVDSRDKCPNRFGVKENGGCPEVKIEKEDLAVLTQAMKSVEFETGKSSLKSSSFRTLDKIYGMMEKYPRYKLSIGGHTDNVGDPKQNLSLSKARAQSCYDYLVKKGIKPRKLNHAGYGDRKPLQGNDTAEGRQANRRVEFGFNY